MVFPRIPSHLFLYGFISLDLQLIFTDFEFQHATKIDPKSNPKLHAYLICSLFRFYNVFLQDSL